MVSLKNTRLICKHHIWSFLQCMIFSSVCDSSCTTCSGSAATMCTSCPSGQYLNDPDADGSGSCAACDSSCVTCSAGTSSDCTACRIGDYLDDGDSDGSGTCTGQYKNNGNNNGERFILQQIIVHQGMLISKSFWNELPPSLAFLPRLSQTVKQFITMQFMADVLQPIMIDS